MIVNLDNHLLPPFRRLFKEVIDFEYFRLVLKGGRSSGKSIFVAMLIIIGTMYLKRSAICIVRHTNNVAKRLDNVFLKALSILGLSDKYRYVSTKHTFILLNEDGSDSDVEVLCTGADDPERLKGYTPKRGSYWVSWIEEAQNFDNIKAIKNIESTVGRGDLFHFVSIITYNPRMSSTHFLNLEYENIPNKESIISYKENKNTHGSKVVTRVEVDDSIILNQCVFHCTYKLLFKYNKKEWISPTDLVDIKLGEQCNSEYYRWYYLGEVIGNSSVNVFRNIVDWDGDRSCLDIKKKDRGLDISNGGKDPFCYVETYYDKKNKLLYILDEDVHSGEDNLEDVAAGILRINKLNIDFYIDSAVPLTKRELNKRGVHAIAVKKFQDSINAGIIWLQSLQGIMICKQNTPFTYKEFKEYEYELDKYEEVTNKLQDKNNHSIDAVRYANLDNIRFE